MNTAMLVTLIIVWICGGQIIIDMQSIRRDQDLSFFDSLYYMMVWPLIVIYASVKPLWQS